MSTALTLEPRAASTSVQLNDEKGVNLSLDDYDQTYVLSGSELDSSLSADDFDENDETVNISRLLQDIVFGADDSLALADYSSVSQSVKHFIFKHEIPRKVFHSVNGLVAIYFYVGGFQRQQLVVPLWFLFVGTFVNEVIRLHFPAANKRILPYVKWLMRESEVDHWNGIVFFLLGVALITTFTDKDIALMATCLLSWADTAASTFGRAYGKYTPQLSRGKSMAGAMASAVTGTLVCYGVYGYLVPRFEYQSPGPLAWTPELSKMNLHVFAVATGLVSSISEAIDLAGIDDNLTIPVLSAMFLTGLIRVCRI